MGLGSSMGRSRRTTPDLPPDTVQIDIVENPIVHHDPALGAQVAEELRQALAGEDLGEVQVRFRVCRDDADAMKFICKVENPPRVDDEAATPPWRWWSPLLETAEELRQALDEGLRMRRHRLSLTGLR